MARPAYVGLVCLRTGPSRGRLGTGLGRGVALGDGVWHGVRLVGLRGEGDSDKVRVEALCMLVLWKSSELGVGGKGRGWPTAALLRRAGACPPQPCGRDQGP